MDLPEGEKEMNKMPGTKLLWILWVDSSGWSRWQNAQQFVEEEILKDDPRCESVGWVICEDKESISIAPHRSGNGNIDGVFRIPKRSILKKKVLKVATR